ncbi:MAG: creatininase family protein [Candidatus Bathyarchaeia archaeon]
MVQLAEISWTDAEELFKRNDVALIPVGSTEQHGPHNPLGTDHLVAGALSKVVGERTGVVVLPTIPVGVSEHHRHFPGTLWVPPSAFREYVKAVALSAASHGARKIVFINGHGGNTASLIEVAGELRRTYKVFSAVIMAFPPGMTGHAGAGETSVNLYLHGGLVRMDRAVDTRQKERLGSLKMEGLGRVGPAQFSWDTIDLSDTGVLGAAGEVIASSEASEGEGRRLMEPYIEEICRFVEELKAAKLDDLISKPLR